MKSIYQSGESVPRAISRRILLRNAGLIGAVSALPRGLQPRVLPSVADMGALLKASLKPTHPRLHLDDAGWLALRANLASTELKQPYASLQHAGEKLLTAPVAQYKLVGPRLLTESRRALNTISTLAGLYRLNAEIRFADRAREELAAICAFPSWHPPHFLDVAELTNAAALGYDWLYDMLSEQERSLLRNKIVKFGLRPGLKEYESGVWWSKPLANNWGQVCGGGLTVGALAIANDGANDPGGTAPEPAAILHWTISKVPNAMMNYAPDGGWPEGPSYWAYATNYTCSMISALDSCLARDFGLAAMPGFSETGTFRVASIGPAGLFFNYADGSAEVAPAPEMVWLGNRFRRPLYLASERDLIARKPANIFHLVWFKPAVAEAQATPAPALDIEFTRIDVAYLRSSWTDPDAFFLGIKGGNNAGSHAHLDLGSFVLDALGQRWALDLGPDNYDLPDYFGKLRWTYYRMRTEGHNTLTFGQTDNQVLTATAALQSFSTSPQVGKVSVDLHDAYPGFKRLRRTATLERGIKPRLILEDAYDGSAHPLRWSMHTDAAIDLRGSQAMLAKNGKNILLTLQSPSGATFAMISASAPPPQAQQPQIHNLIVDYTERGGPKSIRITFEAA